MRHFLPLALLLFCFTSCASGAKAPLTAPQRIAALVDPAACAAEAVQLVGMSPAAAQLTVEAMLRNLRIASQLGCLTPEGLAEMRRGRSPTITLGPYAGDQLSVDHIIPFSLAPVPVSSFIFQTSPFQLSLPQAPSLSPFIFHTSSFILSVPPRTHAPADEHQQRQPHDRTPKRPRRSFARGGVVLRIMARVKLIDPASTLGSVRAEFLESCNMHLLPLLPSLILHGRLYHQPLDLATPVDSHSMAALGSLQASGR